MAELESVVDESAFPIGAMAETRWFAGDGWAIRRADRAAREPVRGSLLFVPGRGDFFEKYGESLVYWNSRGWCVTALDWRGQGLSGRLGTDSLTGHVDDFAIWVADLAAFWAEWKTAAPGPHVLVAHSMGGHLVLRALAEGRIDPDAVILTAPMLGFITHGVPLRLLHWVARAMCALGDPRRPAWKWSEKPGALPAGRAELLTHDPVRYAQESDWRGRRPGLAMGPGSWGWLRAATASMLALDRRGVLEKVRQPILMLATSDDRLVSSAAIDRAARRLPHAEYLRFGPESAHEILREADPVRDRALAAIDDFLDRKARLRH